ncbi:MAG: polysaccharide pyruvyl transferase family protein [Okeania sp. SIO3C4]|nr:polysaccharide pyruvyl transferase family protein [Okeania sp. SIO3B3]NER01473.1 polysaccharide pyruvyl transferase family protein [Okeania sp. SIO3C4]
MYSALKYEQGKSSGGTVNVGDMIQTLAAVQYLPKIDYYLERRQGKNISSDLPDSFCIMNGWYSSGMLPPPPNITPFYISIHINTPEMLTDEVVKHLKEHQPIGCRDRSTLNLLKSYDVDSYYSGCLTLSFPTIQEKTPGKIYIVNLDQRGLKLVPEEIKEKAVSVDYITYRDLLTLIKVKKGKILRPIEGVTERFQEILEIPQIFINPEFSSLFPKIWTDKELENLIHLFKARSLLKMYSKASLVITNRLHCASPCLALGTPVVFIPRKKHLLGDSRFETVGRYIPLNMEAEKSSDIEWKPQPVNVENHKRFLRMLCQKAVEMRENPLKKIPLSQFYEDSGWNN